MWEHYCKIEQTLKQVGEGEDCNWCGLTEATDPVVIGDTKELLIDEDEKDDKELLIDEDDKEGTLIQE